MPQRLISLDAYRGFIMLILASAGLGSVQMAREFPDSWWTDVGRQFSHAAWVGCTLWDLIMPAFILMVGVAMPLSFAARQARGDTFAQQFRHAARRAIVLIALGWLLQGQRSLFLNVLTQIGLGYIFVFLLLNRGFRAQLVTMIAILAGYWALFALYPLPGADFNFAARGVGPNDLLPGFQAHWSRNLNPAADFDIWLLNIFPQDRPFVVNGGSTTTLNFIPTMANMILGVMSGQVLMGSRAATAKLRWVIAVGTICMAAALAMSFVGCPIIKRIWTPSFALFSGAWTLWILAVFYWVIEICGWRRWSFPMVVVGMNSIALYLMHLLWPDWLTKAIKVHFGSRAFAGPYEPVWLSGTILIFLWLCCLWLYRQRIFLKI